LRIVDNVIRGKPGIECFKIPSALGCPSPFHNFITSPANVNLSIPQKKLIHGVIGNLNFDKGEKGISSWLLFLYVGVRRMGF